MTAEHDCSPGIPLDQCKVPGCGRRWTMEFQRHDGYSAFLCEQHGDQYLAEVDQSELKSVTGWMGDVPDQGLIRAMADTDLCEAARPRRDARKQRRKAQRASRRKNR
jgi:hypothetical protein